MKKVRKHQRQQRHGIRSLICFALLAPMPVLAQTGPGGVGTIDGTSNLEAWYNETGMVISINSVLSWSDSSGNGRTNSAVVNMPTRAPAKFNGNDAVHFPGNAHLQNTSNLPLASGDNSLTLVAVWETDTVGAVGVVHEQAGAGGGARASMILVPPQDWGLLLGRTGTSGDFATIMTATSVSGDQIVFTIDSASLTDGDSYTLGIGATTHVAEWQLLDD